MLPASSVSLSASVILQRQPNWQTAQLSLCCCERQQALCCLSLNKERKKERDGGESGCRLTLSLSWFSFLERPCLSPHGVAMQATQITLRQPCGHCGVPQTPCPPRGEQGRLPCKEGVWGLGGGVLPSAGPEGGVPDAPPGVRGTPRKPKFSFQRFMTIFFCIFGQLLTPKVPPMAPLAFFGGKIFLLGASCRTTIGNPDRCLGG